MGVIRITSKPIGFVAVRDNLLRQQADGGADDGDIVVFEENLNCALDKDTVEVEITGRDRDRFKGRIIRILERYKTRFVGTLEKSPFGVVFRPDDFRFYRPVELVKPPKEATMGKKALVEIFDWTTPGLNPKGKVLEVIGEKGVHETEMQSILLDKGIVYDFPPKVEAEAERVAHLPFDVGVRRDFRNVTTFTIDPVDAKDFDDALSYEELSPTVLRIGVHIADVSNFVRPGTDLDKEARRRALSTYLVDRTIPMLPEVLSNDVCSLNPNVDRYAFAAVFDIKKDSGEIIERWFGKTLINSNKRFSYEDAQKVLDTGSGEFLNELRGLERLAKIFRDHNKRNGMIEFETEEVKFVLDQSGKPLQVYKKPRLETMKMIEEWMLLANREVAKFISDKIKTRGGGAASIYRIHDFPKADRIEELAIFLRALGHELPVDHGKVTAKDLNALLTRVEGHASESLIKTAAVRSMAKAIYSVKNIGHFGLAFEYYTHFTSPIRRYADLVVHRVLENHLNGGMIEKGEFEKFTKIAEEVSEREITIAEAERESIKYKQVEYMTDKIGNEFDATITGVTEWGMYVEDPETKAEGMVRLKDMEGDYFELDEKNYAIIGKRTKKKYALGDVVRVKLVAADLDRKTLDFKLI